MRLIALLLSALLVLMPAAPAWAATEEAVLAGGCFWCLEHDLEGLPGVLEVESGYSGGKLANPTYRQVSAGGSGHQESVRVRFDNTKIRYEALLRSYWRNVRWWRRHGSWVGRQRSSRWPCAPCPAFGRPRPITRTTPGAMACNIATTAGPVAETAAWTRSGVPGPGRGIAGWGAQPPQLQPPPSQLRPQPHRPPPDQQLPHRLPPHRLLRDRLPPHRLPPERPPPEQPPPRPSC